METWKTNLDETKKRYIDWWNHKGIILNMWEHFQEDVKPHADIPAPSPAKDLNQKWFDPQWRAEYLDWYVAHSSLKADILPVANTQLGPGSLAAILGGVFEGGEDTIWIHPDPDFNDEIVFNPEHPNWILHKELLKACKAKANGHYYVGMPDLMEGLDVLAALKGTDKVLLDTVMQPEVLEQQMQQINDIYFKVFDELYDIIRDGDDMAFCYFSSWAPGKMSKLQSDISTMISEDDYRRFVQPFIREQCQKIDYTLYHLDGVGAMHHLPALLEIEELNAIQWTPGVGEPQGGSKIKGSVAAPTAGLHFTERVLAALDERGIDREELTLHVGAGTFKPVKSEEIEGHEMHTEYISVSKHTIEKLIAHNGKAIAVGTTSVRTLESLYYIGVLISHNPDATQDELHVQQWMPYEDKNDLTPVEALQQILDYLNRHEMEALHSSTQIIIAPGYTYKIVKKMVTNFHQPQNTLLLLVSAFVKGNWRRIYDYALGHDFRFLSYGDSSLLIP